MDNNIALVGGVKRRGAWRMSRHLVAVSAIGGVNADLTEARFDTAESTLTKVSLVGGVSMTVPHDVDVEVGGFSLFGGSNIEQAHRSGPATHTVRVRNYGLFGGVSVRR